VRHRQGKPRPAPARLRRRRAALPDARLIERRGLGHAKKLTPTVIAATLTDFFTTPDLTTPAPNGEHHA